MDIFEYQHKKFIEKESPLASRMRPTSLDNFIGQEHIIGKNTLLYRAIKSDRLTSIILYGPSGTGKTTMAKIIAHTTKGKFININATTQGVKDIKAIIEEAKNNISISNIKTILFVDEIHAFNKSQQDVLLPYVENGTIILIGATTENPYFEVNKALLSRSTIFFLEPLTEENIENIILSAITDKEKGLAIYKPIVNKDAISFIAYMSNGDARVALNAIELAVLTTQPLEDGNIYIDLEIAKECIQRKIINYDKNGDNHYNVTSAFIKSMRGSDADAALYYLGYMLHSGEDPNFIARRMVICASEDVGNADPMALSIAVSAAQATEFIGMPECRIVLAQAVTYIATAPKSNASYLGINQAMDDVANIKIKDIPKHLKDSHYKGAKNLDNGVGYKYVHNYDNNYVEQQYLPNELVGKKYYNPTNNGYEKQIKKRLKNIESQKG